MNLRELARTLHEEMELLDQAIEEANNLLGQKLNILTIVELEPILAYAATLRTRIRALEHGIDYAEHERERYTAKWRELLEQTRLPDEKNKYPW